MQVPFFAGTTEKERGPFITAVSLQLKPEAYAPDELIIRPGELTEKMYIIQRGIVGYQGRIKSSGSFIGEDMILHNAHRDYAARAMTCVFLVL